MLHVDIKGTEIKIRERYEMMKFKKNSKYFQMFHKLMAMVFIRGKEGV